MNRAWGLWIAFGLILVSRDSFATLPDATAPVHKPLIAVVIDDMGLDLKRSRWALDLPPAVTVSYLPYSLKIAEQVRTAQEKGHEVILHIPMQADNAKEDPGPHPLSVDLSEEQLEKNIAANLDAFTGYDGVNNHMGSRFTTYRPGLELLMTELERRHVYFMDSRTTSRSIAEQVAREHHLQTTHRDVFIDNEETGKFVADELNHAEDVARVTGSVVAIGHPHDATLASLEVWLATLEKKGFKVVPLSEVIEYRNKALTAANK
jgi:polysaccharide deacetylase 2 family uncharacterized protein YibQ